MTIDLHIKNAHVWDGGKTTQRDLYTANGRIVEQPANGAQVVDLDGYTIFPGLVNAHDHLELNHYPRSKFREVYDNAHQWGEDMNARLDTEPYKSLRMYPLWDRLFIGGLKNLLCGATTVAHHGPPHKPMFHKDFPVRVLKNYGWAHSLHFNTEQEIVESYRKTPKDWPWFIHLAEGTDEVARNEFARLQALGCVRSNTVLVHGVGLTFENVESAWASFDPDEEGSVELVWCPTSNFYVLGEKAHEDEAITNGHWSVVNASMTLIGSDSRLTSDGDFLDELHYAAQIVHWVPDMITANFDWMYPKDYPPDFVILPQTENPAKDLLSLSRKDLPLVIFNGIPEIGDPAIMAKFPQVQTVAATLDGAPKAIHIDLARRIHQCALKEPGLEVDALPTKRFWLI